MSDEKRAEQADQKDNADEKKAAKPASSVVPVVVLELIEESETIQGWMERLDENAEEGYPEVLQRVKDDYRGRLTGVGDQLAEHQQRLEHELCRVQELADRLASGEISELPPTAQEDTLSKAA